MRGDLLDAVLAYLDTSASHVEEVYQLDVRGGWLNPADQDAKELIDERTAAGAAMLRNLVYRAWKKSALPRPPRGVPPTDAGHSDYNA